MCVDRELLARFIKSIHRLIGWQFCIFQSIILCPHTCTYVQVQVHAYIYSSLQKKKKNYTLRTEPALLRLVLCIRICIRTPNSARLVVAKAALPLQHAGNMAKLKTGVTEPQIATLHHQFRIMNFTCNYFNLYNMYVQVWKILDVMYICDSIGHKNLQIFFTNNWIATKKKW